MANNLICSVLLPGLVPELAKFGAQTSDQVRNASPLEQHGTSCTTTPREDNTSVLIVKIEPDGRNSGLACNTALLAVPAGSAVYASTMLDSHPDHAPLVRLWTSNGTCYIFFCAGLPPLAGGIRQQP
jgi:hypothetical protein